MEIIHVVKSLKGTEKLASLLANHLKGKVILLKGEIGSGKTTFARYFINSLFKIPQIISSPTFSIVQSYEEEDTVVYHLDLYRIKSEEELFNLHLQEEVFNFTCLVEWSENLGSYTPQEFIEVFFNYSNNMMSKNREIIIKFSQGNKTQYDVLKNLIVTKK